MTATVRVGIQADDLTGACDTGAAFAARGLATVVLLFDAGADPGTADVVVLDTESRVLPAEAARARARAAAERLATHQPALLYKKLDSTLRGPLAAELAGAREGGARSWTLLAPAFPAQGRTVVDGLLRVDGHRADLTAVARDPEFPPTGASVLALVGGVGPHPVGHAPLATLRARPDALAARLRRWSATGGTLVSDAETDADLAALAAATEGAPALLAGSAGLARAVAARFPARPPAGSRPRRPLLVISGSAHPATAAQLERLAGRGVPGLWLTEAEATDSGGTPDRGDRFVAARAGARATEPAARAAMAARLAAEARAALDRAGRHGAPIGTLVLIGGDTAVAVCRALDASGLRLAGEVEPGLATGTLLDGAFAGLTTVTKAGGFGDPEALVRLWEQAA